MRQKNLVSNAMEGVTFSLLLHVNGTPSCTFLYQCAEIIECKEKHLLSDAINEILLIYGILMPLR